MKNGKIKEKLVSRHVVKIDKDGSLNIDNYIDSQTDRLVYFADAIIAAGTLPLWVYVASLVSDTPLLRMAGFVVGFILPFLLNEKYLARGNRWRRYYQTNQNLPPKERKRLLLKGALGWVIMLAIFVLCWVFLSGK